MAAPWQTSVALQEAAESAPRKIILQLSGTGRVMMQLPGEQARVAPKESFTLHIELDPRNMLWSYWPDVLASYINRELTHGDTRHIISRMDIDDHGVRRQFAIPIYNEEGDVVLPWRDVLEYVGEQGRTTLLTAHLRGLRSGETARYDYIATLWSTSASRGRRARDSSDDEGPERKVAKLVHQSAKDVGVPQPARRSDAEEIIRDDLMREAPKIARKIAREKEAVETEEHDLKSPVEEDSEKLQRKKEATDLQARLSAEIQQWKKKQTEAKQEEYEHERDRPPWQEHDYNWGLMKQIVMERASREEARLYGELADLTTQELVTAKGKSRAKEALLHNREKCVGHENYLSEREAFVDPDEAIRDPFRDILALTYGAGGTQEVLRRLRSLKD